MLTNDADPNEKEGKDRHRERSKRRMGGIGLPYVTKRKENIRGGEYWLCTSNKSPTHHVRTRYQTHSPIAARFRRRCRRVSGRGGEEEGMEFHGELG